MEASSQPVLLDGADDLDSAAELGVVPRPAAERAAPRRRQLARGAAVAVALFVVAAVVSGKTLSTGGSGGQSATDGVVALSAEVGAADNIAYGLHEVNCPEGDDQDKSDDGVVTIDSIKDMVGCDDGAEVKFWWVYPLDKAKMEKLETTTAAEEGFALFGGYKYACGDKAKCYALGKGNTLTLEHTEPVPETEDWHKVTIQGLNYTEFAWVPPDEKSCKHGCFVYKNEEGHKAAMMVGAGRVGGVDEDEEYVEEVEGEEAEEAEEDEGDEE